MTQSFFWAVENVLRLIMVTVNNSVNTLKIIELHTLNRWITWYVNYISKKLFKNASVKENILIRALLIAQGQTKKQQIKLLQMFKKKKKKTLKLKRKEKWGEAWIWKITRSRLTKIKSPNIGSHSMCWDLFRYHKGSHCQFQVLCFFTF